MKMYYESFNLKLLYNRGKALGIPVTIWRLEINIYTGPRRFILEDMVTDRVFAEFGIPAGSRFSNCCLVMHTLKGLGRVTVCVCLPLY